MVERAFIDHLETQWSRMAELCADLSAEEWRMPTDCPGWTVRDQLGHVVGSELSLLGEQAPTKSNWPEHVHNDLGAFNEAWIESFRAVSTDDLLARFRDVTARRLDALRRSSDEDLQAPTESPMGTIPYHEFMQIRVMDCWIHEQDIRCAAARPGGVHGGAAEAAIDRLLHTLGYVLAKKVRPPDDSTILLRLHGPVVREQGVHYSEGRGRLVDPPSNPTTTLSTDAATFARLAAGRWTANTALEAGLVGIEGEVELGQSLLACLATTP